MWPWLQRAMASAEARGGADRLDDVSAGADDGVADAEPLRQSASLWRRRACSRCRACGASRCAGSRRPPGRRRAPARTSVITGPSSWPPFTRMASGPSASSRSRQLARGDRRLGREIGERARLRQVGRQHRGHRHQHRRRRLSTASGTSSACPPFATITGSRTTGMPAAAPAEDVADRLDDLAADAASRSSRSRRRYRRGRPRSAGRRTPAARRECRRPPACSAR